jgi:DNA-binding response OmpR family regulator
MDKKVLIAAEAPETHALVVEALADSDFRLSRLPQGRSLLLQVGLSQPDLVILHVPAASGDRWVRLEQIRERSWVPLIVLLDADDGAGRSEGLERGADVCLAVPFEPEELRARASALLRRVQYAARLVPAYGQ